MGGWKRGLPGPVEKGRRGLAEVLLGIRGEVVAPGKQLEEMGFTRPEVLGGRKDREVRDGAQLLGQSLTKHSPGPPELPLTPEPELRFQPDGPTKGSLPNPLRRPTPPQPHLSHSYALASSRS